MTFQRQHGLQGRSTSCARCGRTRASWWAATTRAWPPRPTPRTDRESISSCAARASSRSASCSAPWRPATASTASPASPTATANGFHANPDRPVRRLEDGELKPPRRDARVLAGYTLLGRQVDVIETSRGCTFDCSFCSIIEMRGRNFHVFDFDRVLADIRDARDHGAAALFIVDDNITLNVQALRGPVPGHRGRGPEHDRLHRPGHDLRHRQRRRQPGPAHAQGRLPLRVPGDRERPRRGPRLPARGAKNERREHGRKTGNATVAAIDALHRQRHVRGGRA